MNRLRYLIGLLLLSGLLAGRPLLAQDTVRQFVRPTLLKTNLGEPISLVLEAPTANRQSLQVGVQYFGINFLGRIRLLNLTPAYKFYLSKSVGSERRPAPKGLYLSPYLRYHRFKTETDGWWTNESSTTIRSMFGGGVVVGAQFINWSGLTLDGFFGGGYSFLLHYRVIQYNPPNPPPTTDPNWPRYNIRIGLCIGVAFVRPDTD